MRSELEIGLEALLKLLLLALLLALLHCLYILISLNIGVESRRLASDIN